MAQPPLACGVRGCALPLLRRDRTFVCAAGHSYDVARSGYVNLLQPQDRRSADAGDSRVAIEARASLLAAGVGRALIDAVASRAAFLNLPEAPVVTDLGCGSGDALAALTSRAGLGVGIDLSVAAIERAARHFPDRTWVVANADRRLPLLDRSIDLVMSLHARRNPVETARVLSPTGVLLIAVPASDDLIELREVVQGERVERDRSDVVLKEHELFALVDRSAVRETREFDRDGLLKLLRGTYRGVRHGAAERVAALTRMTVTLASEIFAFRLR
ncbi:MAG TPA: methyltransferase domain-containing protein [Vicinamibacterales bacterium]